MLCRVVLQVFELDPGIQSGSIWREVAMLRDCTHEHVVPLYGVSIKVCDRSLTQINQKALITWILETIASTHPPIALGYLD